MMRQLGALTTMKEQTTDPIAPTSIVDTSRYPSAGLANRFEGSLHQPFIADLVGDYCGRWI